jgi:PAP2 superfamily
LTRSEVLAGARALGRGPGGGHPEDGYAHRLLGLLFLAFGLFLTVNVARHGGLPGPGPLAVILLSAALWSQRGSRFLRAWVPVLLGFLAYRLGGQMAQQAGFPVHFEPQIDADRVLGLGAVPTVWLQHHLTAIGGVLEYVSVSAYLTHFVAPLALGFVFWWKGSKAFSTFMLAVLTATALGELTFLLFPTAPPWLAAEQGFLPHLEPVIRQGLQGLHLDQLADLKGNAARYNIVAAVPSLHVAWPVIGLLALRKHRFPGWAQLLQGTLAVWVAFAVVYSGEHYLVDVVAGVAYALLAFRLVSWATRTRAPSA